MPATVHLAARIYAEELVNNPDGVLQKMSMKVYQRRQELLRDLQNTRVRYEDDSGVQTAILNSVEGFHAHLYDGGKNFVVPVRRLRLD